MFVQSIAPDLEVLKSGISAAVSSGTLGILLFGLLVACIFEFINGFHDTANAVATVIYTRSLRPWTAVVWSGICNFIGVFLGGITVAMGILKLLPIDILVSGTPTLCLVTVFSLLLSSCLWNFGTWYFGIPASSSHALVGGILGVGLGYSLDQGIPISSGVNWSKAGEIGLSLLVSPLLGFALAALGLILFKKLIKSPKLHRAPGPNGKPPFWIRLALITTSSGVSLAHGSNDGQKGVGLVMLILLAILPAQFSLAPESADRFHAVHDAALSIKAEVEHLRITVPASSSAILPAAHAQAGPPEAVTPATEKLFEKVTLLADEISAEADMLSASPRVDDPVRIAMRKRIMELESTLKKIEKSGYEVSTLSPARKTLSSVIEFAPFWVLGLVAFSLGLGTMIGWKRIVVTIGEKIGKTHLTYAQGAVSETVAMSMIGFSALAGVPVSTTHCLSSGVAGTMVAQGSGVQPGTVRKIVMAWILTLPVTILLSAMSYLLLKWALV
jgi:PiT family inorganic phosphate transporter